MMGTFIYAAPGLLQHANRVDVRADIYALGMVGIFVLAQGQLDSEVVWDLSATLSRIEMPEGLRAILSRACARERERRFSSVVEMLDQLRQFAQHARTSPST
jgi:serine/threonine protein kinase